MARLATVMTNMVFLPILYIMNSDTKYKTNHVNANCPPMETAISSVLATNDKTVRAKKEPHPSSGAPNIQLSLIGR